MVDGSLRSPARGSRFRLAGCLLAILATIIILFGLSYVGGGVPASDRASVVGYRCATAVAARLCANIDARDPADRAVREAAREPSCESWPVTGPSVTVGSYQGGAEVRVTWVEFSSFARRERLEQIRVEDACARAGM